VRVIGVIDLLDGRAVHARGGRRETYQPVRCVAERAIEPGDTFALARGYIEQLGISELYAADLDALTGRPSQEELVATLAAFGTLRGAPLLLDAGVTSVDGARHAIALGADRVVVALETLPGYGALREVCAAVGGERVAFSLDLRNSRPIVASAGAIPADEPADVVASRAKEAGAGTVIVIDLARVGTGRGLDLELLARVRDATPGLTLLAGGGVGGFDDLAQLGDAGCDGALLATALHDGRIGAIEIAAAGRHRSFSR
jgi:phosphoribosylformimino-5-aminoimidazole carboxamide ribotide isomerase